jgi:glycosyltransferase involved in cell wall biosynthesis
VLVMSESETALPPKDERPRLLFVSPRFLFPAHSGGAIRTGQILRGMKGGRFHITLVSPGSVDLERAYRDELAGIADAWEFWTAPNTEDRSRLSKARHLLDRLPLTVAADRSRAGGALVRRALAARPSIVVIDFVHAAVLLPSRLGIPSVVFTHNCEAEIYERHAANEEKRWMRPIWRQQARKMERFERDVLRRVDGVIAVAERDAQRFAEAYGLRGVQTIPTGVELEKFIWHAPQGQRRVVFAGSMDSAANIDGVRWLLTAIWPSVLQRVRDARLVIVGKRPPADLQRLADAVPGVEFTGRVPDVGPYLSGADAFVIPLRVGGGTRMKAYEAMAAGAPVVSTTIGTEGLGLEEGRHYLRADDPDKMAVAISDLLTDAAQRQRVSADARAFVDEHASHRAAARCFEDICMAVVRGTGDVATARRAGGPHGTIAQATP